ncbi:MAG: HEPN domain-containing protein [Myxococcales bacterium]|nr:HEPN domain-containing protein [Myxococcales bacterium]
MTQENRRRNIELELEKGEASLKAAGLCLQAALWDDAVSRAYYCALHYAQALLLTLGLEARSHHGVHDLLYLHFVRPGQAPARLSKLLAGLQKYREEADYARAFRFSEQGAREEVANATEIRDFVRVALAEQGWLTS